MKKIYRAGRFFIAAIPALYVANFFCRDLFILSANNKFLFFAWAFPGAHLVWICIQLMMMITGRQYRKHKEFSVVKINPSVCKIFPSQRRPRRFFFTVKVNNRDRIVSGLFWSYPAFVLIYKNAFDKLKALTLCGFCVKFIWLLAGWTVLVAIRFLVLDGNNFMLDLMQIEKKSIILMIK
jgi:hypothetical protein